MCDVVWFIGGFIGGYGSICLMKRSCVIFNMIVLELVLLNFEGGKEWVIEDVCKVV